MRFRPFVLSLAAGALLAAGGCDSGTVDPPLPPPPPLLAECEGGVATVGAAQFPCSGIGLAARVSITNLTPGGGSGNDLWGWTDPDTDREYALVGNAVGTVFVDVTDYTAPVVLGTLPTTTTASTWRDIKTYRHYALVVADAAGNHGVQIFDLTRLRGLEEDPARMFTSDARYRGVRSSHNIVVNEETGFAYAVGASPAAGFPEECTPRGLHAIDLSDPLDPRFAGCFTDVPPSSGATIRTAGPTLGPAPTAQHACSGDDCTSRGYTHDAQCVVYDGPDPDYTGQELCFASNEDVVTVFDLTDKTNAVLVSTASYNRVAYTHQNWLTEDHRYLLVNDELDEVRGLVDRTRTLVFDMEDVDAPLFLFQYLGPSGSIDHNLYVRDGFAYEANYTSGLRVVDLSRIGQRRLTEVAYFDTYPADDAQQFDGAWSVYPYFASGTLLVNDISRGLFVLRPSFEGAP